MKNMINNYLIILFYILKYYKNIYLFSYSKILNLLVYYFYLLYN